MLVGNLAALVQTDLKRMLAYSSIAHAGYVLMGLSAAGSGQIHGDSAIASILFYLVAYTFMNAGAFIVLSTFTSLGTDHTDLKNLAGLGRSHPWLAAALSLCLLSMAGIPPTIGFVGKFYLFMAAIESGQTSLAIIGAISAAIGVYYYLRPMLYMYMHHGTPAVTLSRSAMVGLAVAAVAIVLFGIAPSAILGWAQDSLASVLPPI
jgi:NADH-quinone oxidoreductase subunit N